MGFWTRKRVPYPHLHYRYAYDIGNVLGLKVFGFVAEAGAVKWDKRPAVLACLVLISPIWIAALLHNRWEIPPGQAPAYYFWLAYFPALSLVVTFFSWAGVMVFWGLTRELESMLTPAGYREYEDWADVATANGPQAVFAVTFSSLACLVLWIASHAEGMADAMFISPVSYVSLFISCLFISGGAYWIFMGTVLSVPLTGPGMMHLSPYIPASTPGMELLARCYRMAFYGASVGVMLCLVPILSWAYSVDPTLILSGVKVFLILAAGLAVLTVGVIPQWRLSRVVFAARRKSIRQLGAALPADTTGLANLTAREEYLLSWLQTVAASPSATVNPSSVAGLLLGLALALAPAMYRFVAGG